MYKLTGAYMHRVKSRELPINVTGAWLHRLTNVDFGVKFVVVTQSMRRRKCRRDARRGSVAKPS